MNTVGRYLLAGFCLVYFALQSGFSMLYASTRPLHAAELPSHDPFVIFAIPKCGSHLLMRCMELMTQRQVTSGCAPWSASQLSKDAMIDYLAISQRDGILLKFFNGYYPELENVFLEAGYKWLFMVRDPRDALVSLVPYIGDRQGLWRDFFYTLPEFDTLSFDDRLTAVMLGTCCHSYPAIFYKPMLAWARNPRALIVHYEDLIGSEGGGSKEVQFQTLQAIADHLHLKLTDDELENVAVNLFSTEDAYTIEGRLYQRGQVGNWRLFFTDVHKQIYETVFGSELLEFGYPTSCD